MSLVAFGGAHSLTRDTWNLIFRRLVLSDLLRARITCRAWNAVLLDCGLLSQVITDRYCTKCVWRDTLECQKGPVVAAESGDSEFDEFGMKKDALLYCRELLLRVVEWKDVLVLQECLHLLGPYYVNMRDMGSFGASAIMSAEFNFLRSQDLTLLHYGVFSRREDIVRLLLENGASPNVPSFDGDCYGERTLAWTPLTCAAYCGDAHVVRMLLLNGASPELKAFLLKGYELDGEEDCFAKSEYQARGMLRECTAAEIAAYRKNDYVCKLLSMPIPKWIRVQRYFAPDFSGKFHGGSDRHDKRAVTFFFNADLKGLREIFEKHTAETQGRRRIQAFERQRLQGAIEQQAQQLEQAQQGQEQRPIRMLTCSLCGLSITANNFSNNQLKKKGHRRCQACVLKVANGPKKE
jgi:hypothetical protein